MELRPDGSVLAETALSMSRLQREEPTGDAVEIARLVRLTLAGNSGAFEQIILRYEMRVMTIAARVLGTRDDARDVAQEVFLRAFKYLHRLDLQKPLEPWLLRITVNVCRDAARRKRQRLATFVDIDESNPVDQSPDPHAGFVSEERRAVIRRALETLPEKERLAIVLRDIEGLSTSEVASILQSSETTVRSQMSRGRLKLKAAVDRLTGGKP